MSAVDVLAVLDHHAAGMRGASKTKVGIKLSPQGCANLSDELSEARAAVAELIEANRKIAEIYGPLAASMRIGSERREAWRELFAALARCGGQP